MVGHLYPVKGAALLVFPPDKLLLKHKMAGNKSGATPVNLIRLIQHGRNGPFTLMAGLCAFDRKAARQNVSPIPVSPSGEVLQAHG